ncbi:receptor-like cytoplasmic kinase 176 [Tanacetum coccineum]|uniref:Receptor-like cytoplasmic kinase 176 n=1 Tax=Tanacetum coccineum TaxID=301880 RepID=A0ABQ5BR56_9ASTR
MNTIEIKGLDLNLAIVDLDTCHVRLSSGLGDYMEYNNEDEFENGDEESNDNDSEAKDKNGEAEDILDKVYIVDEVEVNMIGFRCEVDAYGEIDSIEPIQPHMIVIKDDMEVLDFDLFKTNVGTEFENRYEANERVRPYSVECRRNIELKKNDKKRGQGKGKEQVTINGKDKVKGKVKGKELYKNICKKNSHVGVSKTKAFKAKTKVQVHLRGDAKVQYSLLRVYVTKLQRCNQNNAVKIDVYREEDRDSETHMFRRIYVCLGALKMGFKAYGREMLGLDGTFMRGPYPRQLLTTVGVDAYNGIYPMAYGIVESESRHSWTWLLNCRRDDLDLYSNSNFTFIANRKKGLLSAIAKLFPAAKHRYCDIDDEPDEQEFEAHYMYTAKIQEVLNATDAIMDLPLTLTKHYAARYYIEGIEDMISDRWSKEVHLYQVDALNGIHHWDDMKKDFFKAEMGNRSTHKVYSNKRIIIVVSVNVKKKWGYSFLTSIKVKRTNNNKYEFSYADLSRLNLNNIEDMYLMKVQGKLHHLKLKFEIDFINALLLYIRRELIRRYLKLPLQHKRELSTLTSTMIKSLMKCDEVHKFCDGTLLKVQYNLLKMLNENKLGRGNVKLEGREWTKYDIKRSEAMLEKIEKTLKHREQLRRLEEYVGGRPKTIYTSLFVRP